MKRLPVTPRALAALTLLLACGDNGGGTVSASGTGSTGATGDTSTSTSTGTGTATTGGTDDPTMGGSMGQTDSATTSSGTTTTTTATSSTTDTTSDTTQGVDTQGTTEGSTSTTTTTTEGSTSTSSSTGVDTTGVDSTGGEEPCACPDIEVPLDDGIFVLSDDAELWKYYPESNSFTMLGNFNCNGMTSTFSMAVDRLGFAWVMFNNPQGEIWKIDVTNPGNCIDPGYNPGQLGIEYFGMAFVSNSEFDQCDSLYGNTFDGFGGFSEGPNVGDFINLDPMTLQIKTISKSNFNGAEMTGTGDGRVFSFGGVPSKLIERDKANGTVLSTFPLANLPLTNAFAFAFFGGDFYFFTEANGNPNISKVTHLDYDDSDNDGMQELTTINAAAPIRIVGAGVSTCAPFAPM